MMLIRAISIVACLALPASVIEAVELRHPLARPDAGEPGAGTFNCPAVPPPIVDHSDVVFYTDNANSVVNETKWRERLALNKPIRAFSEKIAVMANLYRAGDKRQPAIAQCVAGSIAAWAKGGAFLGHVTTWARYDTLWFGQISLGVSYLKVAQDPAISKTDKAAIAGWLAEIARAATADHAKLSVRNPTSNLRAWLAAAQLVAAVAANDHALFSNGLISARAVLETVTPEGALPAEIGRRRRAFGYHIWALEPLALAALLAQANGVDLAAEHNGALWRIAHFILRNGKDPAEIIRLAGTEQDGIERFPQAWQLGFAEILLAMSDDPKLLSVVKPLRPIVSPFTGGNWTATFKPRD
jgi:poly(beta-D-mannuronate) lyase